MPFSVILHHSMLRESSVTSWLTPYLHGRHGCPWVPEHRRWTGPSCLGENVPFLPLCFNSSVLSPRNMVGGLFGAPFTDIVLTWIPAWISNPKPGNMWDDITSTNTFPNFNECTVEVWEWISNFIPHFVMHVFAYPCWKLVKSSYYRVALQQTFVKITFLLTVISFHLAFTL